MWREKFIFFKDTDEIENYSMLSDLEISFKEGVNYLLGHEFVHYADKDSSQKSQSQNGCKTGLHFFL